MRWIWILISTFAIAGIGMAGEVKTSDGRTYTGTVGFDGSQVTISTIDSNLRIDPAKIEHATFTPPVAQIDPSATIASLQGRGLKAEFFDYNDLKNLLLTRLDSQLDFFWPSGNPDPCLPVRFSARWTGQITAPQEGTYTLTLAHDDGARMWVDGKLVLDKWVDGDQVDSASVFLPGKQPTPIRIELFNSVRSSRMKLSWSREDLAAEVVPVECLTPPVGFTPDPEPNAHGWFASYYNNKYLVAPVLTRIDSGVNFDWRGGGPDPRIEEPFGVCWIANLTPPATDHYTFSTFARDGIRVSVDGKSIIDRWLEHEANATGSIDLEGGKPVTVIVSYFNTTRDPEARLLWSSSSFKSQLIPRADVTPATVGQRMRLLKTGGLRGEYFDDQTFKTPRLIRNDPCLDFDWNPGDGRMPDTSLPETFASRWTGRLISPGNGQYTLYVDVDDGGRIYLDGKMALDAWNKGFGSYSGPFTFIAGHIYDFKAEHTNIGGGPAAMRFYWSGPNMPKQIVDPSHFLLPPGDTISNPQVVLKPLGRSFFLAGEAINLFADASEGVGSALKRVEFLQDGHLIGSCDHPPYVFAWKNAPAGRFTLSAKAIDEKGYQGKSARIPITVTAAAPAAFGEGWMDYHVGDSGGATDTAIATGSASTITAGPGDVWSNSDGLHYVFHALDGDGQLTARILSLKSDHTDNLPAVGIMARQDLTPGSRDVAAMLVNSPDPNLVFTHRDDPGGDLNFVSAPAKAPVWLRLERIGSHLTAYNSADGQHWDIAGEIDLPAGAMLLGVAVTAKNQGLATAIVDHLELRVGPRKTLTSAAGIQMRDGSIFAGDILSADSDHVRFRFHGQQFTVNTAEVARLLFHPISVEANEAVGPDRTGMMLANGDFVDGDFSDVTDNTVSISSVLFGKQRLGTGDAVLAVLLRDAKPADGFIVRAADGSEYRVPVIKINAGQLQVSDPAGGAVGLMAADIKSIDKVN